MVKSKNIIAGLGVVAGLGMALMPLGAFATPSAESNAASHTIRGVVGDVISITVAAPAAYAQQYQIGTDSEDNPIMGDYSLMSLVPGELNADLEHTVTVNTNTRDGYALKMYAATANDVNLRYITAKGTGDLANKATAYHETVKIANIGETTGSELTGNDYGWGYKVKQTNTPAAGGYSTTYGSKFLPIPASENAGTIATVAASRSNDQTGKYTDTFKVNFGIRPAEDQLAGEYEATVVYKAVTNAI